MVPLDVEVDMSELDEAPFSPDAESKFYSCHVCGDNWLTVKEEETEGDYQITFVHQMGMQPTLKRIGHMPTPVIVSENAVDYWEYFLDGEPIDEDIWHKKLTLRRKILKSICSN